uniref:Uncharacterized protein n=1 Tax=Ixodes ricinus TaxID=34613 RepID=A0A147BS55_IXORI
MFALLVELALYPHLNFIIFTMKFNVHYVQSLNMKRTLGQLRQLAQRKTVLNCQHSAGLSQNQSSQKFLISQYSRTCCMTLCTFCWRESFLWS